MIYGRRNQMIVCKAARLGLFCLGIFAVVACATPQQRAIAAHCEAEGLRALPRQLVIQQVVRPVYVGDRTVGSRNKCKTETKVSKNNKGDTVQVRETICVDEPITEPVYKNQLVNESVDLNALSRQNFIRVCVADALSKGMYAHLK